MPRLSSLRSWSEARQTAVFFVLTFALSWGLWLPAAMASDPAAVPPIWGLGSFGPSVAGILVLGLFHGTGGLRSLGRRLVRGRVPPRWYVVALGLPLAMAAGVVLLNQTLREVAWSLAPLVPPEQIPGSSS